MRLSPADAAALYASGLSACQIAADRKLSRKGVEDRIRAGGLGGVQWCPLHRTYEELTEAGSTDTGPVPTPVPAPRPAPEPAAAQGTLF